MNGGAVIWGGAAAALLGLGALSFGLAVVSTSTPEAHVTRYLDALANDDLIDAARLAGLSAETPLPWGDDTDPTIVQIIERTDLPGGDARVVVEYGTQQDAVTATFTLTRGPAHLGIVPVWQFLRPPVATVSVAVDHHDRLRVNDAILITPGAGVSTEITVFVPSRITARLTEAYVTAASESLRVNGSTPAVIMLAAETTAELHRVVSRQVEEFLRECTKQQVLFPTGCPFGVAVTDRAVEPPRWQLLSGPNVEIAPGSVPGRWTVVGNAEMQLTVPVQRLRDGQLSDREETIAANISAEVVLTDDGAELTIYPPRD